MQRNATTTTGRALGLSAAALFILAGTAVSSAQTPPKPTPGATAPTSGAANPSGKLITKSGDQALRDPLAPAAEGNEKVTVDEHLIVDLHVNDEDLSNVLQMLSIQSQKNIVTSKNVSAVVTANLYSVTFYEALDAILHVNGYGYIERGSFIYVYTLDELTKIEKEQRQLVWKLVKLNYLNATDAAEFVKPLLSEHGQIKTNGKAPNYAISENAPTGAEDFANTSTLMVFDYEENLGEIEKVVKEIDTRPAQVLVEATILQTTLNEANAFGVDFSVIGDLNFTDFVNIGGPLRAVDGLINGSGSSGGSGASGGSGGTGGTGGTGSSGSSGRPLPADGKGGAITSNAGNTGGPGTLKMGLVYNDVAAFLRVLDEVSDTTVLSRPNILTLNRQSARVLVGRKVGYLNTTSTDTSSTQTVEFLDTGTQLYFRPFVANDGMIRMELKPKVSDAVIRNVTNSGGSAVTIPDEVTNELTTNVMVRDGTTIVLGGLFREEVVASRRQVPGLGDIPLVGLAFRGHDDSTQRSEIIFMITPTIVNDTTLIDQGERGTAQIDRVRTGTREQLLPWSREKRTGQLVVQATNLMQQGKNDEALYKVQRALEMNHLNIEALQLREQLMSKKTSWPTRSMQHEIISNELGKKIGTPKRSQNTTPAASPLVSVEQDGQVIDQAPTNDPAPVFTTTHVDPAMPEGDGEPTEPFNDGSFEAQPEVPSTGLSNANEPVNPEFNAGTNAEGGTTPVQPATTPEFQGANATEPGMESAIQNWDPSKDPTPPNAAAVNTQPVMGATTPAAAPAASGTRSFGFRSVWGLVRAFSVNQPSNSPASASVPEGQDK